MAEAGNCMMSAAQILFLTCVTLLAYVYVGYPVLVYFVSKIFPKEIKQGEYKPQVTILITAFNEEAAIREKLENTLKIGYPADMLEILVASDGSTDGTDEIVKEFQDRGVKLFRQEGRVGKTATQNNAVQRAAGEIILFSDATTAYGEDLFQALLPSFADESVGCVAGRLIYVDDERTNVGKGAQSYWNYETFLKMAESRACSLIGASGCLYAVRKSAYEPMYPEACSDFLICTTIYRKGLRSVFAPDAVCFEQTNRRADDELRMRVRVISQTFTDLWRNRDMLNPFKSGFFAIELISHKALRYAVPFILFALLIANFVLAGSSAFYAAALWAQLLFYSMAFAGWMMERAGKRLSLLAIPLYFVLANLASLLGFYKFLRGETYTRWEPIRQAR
jgi:cellulose synthase/poly-beta-1,6-N-acetylglucosamine synthase-like glycosyltransferase